MRVILLFLTRAIFIERNVTSIKSFYPLAKLKENVNLERDVVKLIIFLVRISKSTLDKLDFLSHMTNMSLV